MAAKKDSGAIARKRKFVTQRAKELEASGKTVDRAKLRRKWETGMVERDEFYAPGERERLRAGSRSKTAKPTPKQGPPADRRPGSGPTTRGPVDRMPSPKNPKTGKPADRMPQGGPRRMKPADRYPGRRPGTSVTPDTETKKPGSGPRAARPRTGPGGVMLPRRGNTVTPDKETKKPVKKSTPRTGAESKSYTEKKGQRRGPETKSWASRTYGKSPASRFADKYFG